VPFPVYGEREARRLSREHREADDESMRGRRQIARFASRGSESAQPRTRSRHDRKGAVRCGPGAASHRRAVAKAPRILHLVSRRAGATFATLPLALRDVRGVLRA
jgi:hypothetical protein